LLRNTTRFAFTGADKMIDESQHSLTLGLID
jgi:hypothetical protein